VFVAGANIAECAPITTDYIWRARDNGAKLIMADPRVTPLARTADCFLGLRPGTDSALMGAILNQLIDRDLLDHDFIAQHTVGFEEAAAAVAELTPRAAQEITGVPASRIEQAAELWGGPRPGCCCTPAASSTTPRACRTSCRASTSGSRRAATASPAAG
jgi:assimilatory nitrate reductase catalytic subunit